MSLVLAEVEDGVTAVNELSVNQYKTAIETLAGAGWDDSAGDLDVEELSDAVKTPGDGLDYSGGNLVVDASDFAGTGLEDDGSNNLRIAAAAAGDGIQGGGGSALAIDVSDFAGTGLEDDGSENLRIKDSGITVAKMAADALSGKGNTAARPANAKAGYLYDDTETKQLLRDTGAAWEEVTGVIPATQVTDLTDGGATTLHSHAITLKGLPLWRESSVSAADNTSAAAIPTHSKSDANSNVMTVARVQFYKNTYHTTLIARFNVDNTDAEDSAYVRMSISTEVDTKEIAYDKSGDVSLSIDISGLSVGLYEITIEEYWSPGAADNDGGCIVISDLVLQVTMAF